MVDQRDCPNLRRTHPAEPSMRTSHESIYRYVYVVARGELQRELAACLRRHHRTRKPRRRGVAATQGKLQDMVLVDQRPPEVEDRLIPSPLAQGSNLLPQRDHLIGLGG